MTHFITVYTDVPLASLNLSCLKDSVYDSGRSWEIGENEISKQYWDDPMGTAHSLYSDMNMYDSWFVSDRNMLKLAKAYLDYGKEIIFVEMQYKSGNSISRTHLRYHKKITIDLLSFMGRNEANIGRDEEVRRDEI